MALFRHQHRRRRSGIPVKNSAAGSIDTGVYVYNASRKEPPSAREFGPARFTKPAAWYADGIVGFRDGTTARMTMA